MPQDLLRGRNDDAVTYGQTILTKQVKQRINLASKNFIKLTKCPVHEPSDRAPHETEWASLPTMLTFNIAVLYSIRSCTQQSINNLFIQRYMHSLSDPFCLFDFLKTRGPSIHVRLIEFWNTDMVRTHTVCFCAYNSECVCACVV